jgi:hypothetical protein
MGHEDAAMTTHRAHLPRCATCGVEIPWRPAIHRGRTYCCGGCAQGGPCYCSYDLPRRNDEDFAVARTAPGGRTAIGSLAGTDR